MTKVFDRPQDLTGAEGTQLGPTEWLAIDQARVDGFAEVTEDRQWIHVDVERAKAGPFGGTIVHVARSRHHDELLVAPPRAQDAEDDRGDGEPEP